MQIVETLKDIFGQKSALVKADPNALGIELPILTARQFEFFTARLTHLASPVLFVKTEEGLLIRIIESTYRAIQKQFTGNVILYFTKLPTRDRQKLARSNVQFMVADRFLYAPLLGIAGVTRGFIASESDLLERLELSPMAETILVGQLLDGRFTGNSGKEIAQALGITPAAASQALKELEKQELVQMRRTGKSKSANFEERSVLWQKGFRLLKNPVEAELPLETAPKAALKAGLSALADSTMLVDPEQPIWAVYKRGFKQPVSRKSSAMEPVRERCKLQLWHRDPTILSANGMVDQISLFLSLVGATDERIQKELAGLLGNLGLEVPNDKR